MQQHMQNQTTVISRDPEAATPGLDVKNETRLPELNSDEQIHSASLGTALRSRLCLKTLLQSTTQCVSSRI